jgi:hypothetical protein
MLTYFKALRPRPGYLIDEPSTASPHTAELFATARDNGCIVDDFRRLVRARKAGGGPNPQQVVGTSPEVAERRQSSVRNAHRSLVGRRWTGLFSKRRRLRRAGRADPAERVFEAIHRSRFPPPFRLHPVGGCPGRQRACGRPDTRATWTSSHA